jgi:hypothetical protein
MATLLDPAWLFYSEFPPTAVFCDPRLLKRDLLPAAVLKFPLPFDLKADRPNAEFSIPSILPYKAWYPAAVLKLELVLEYSDCTPIAVL